jgi:hypothetical protein
MIHEFSKDDIRKIEMMNDDGLLMLTDGNGVRELERAPDISIGFVGEPKRKFEGVQIEYEDGNI